MCCLFAAGVVVGDDDDDDDDEDDCFKCLSSLCFFLNIVEVKGQTCPTNHIYQTQLKLTFTNSNIWFLYSKLYDLNHTGKWAVVCSKQSYHSGLDIPSAGLPPFAAHIPVTSNLLHEPVTRPTVSASASGQIGARFALTDRAAHSEQPVKVSLTAYLSRDND